MTEGRTKNCMVRIHSSTDGIEKSDIKKAAETFLKKAEMQKKKKAKKKIA